MAGQRQSTGRAGRNGAKPSATSLRALHSAVKSAADRASVHHVERLEPRIVLSAQPALGVNLDKVTDYSTAWVFTDAFQESRDWMLMSYNTVTGQEAFASGSNPVPAAIVDANGWPTQLVSWTNSSGQLMQQRLATVMFDGIGGHYPAGTYRAEWEGSGTLTVGYDGNKITQGTYTNADGKIINYADVAVTPGNAGVLLKIIATDTAAADPAAAVPTGPIRNLHFWIPDSNGQSFAGKVWQPGASFSPFNPVFLDKLKPYSTLRFKDWQDTDGSAVVNWADRTQVTDARQSEFTTGNNGVAYEYMIELANELHDDVWLNLPYAANSDYITNLATLFSQNLNPGQKVYIEWGNEIWNSGSAFTAYPWITSQLQAHGLSTTNDTVRYTYAAGLIKSDFDVFSSVYAQSGRSADLVRVVAGMASSPNAQQTDTILSNMGGSFDAVSASGYFNVSTATRATYTASTTATQVLTDARAQMQSGLNGLLRHKALADKYSTLLGRPIELVAYEGGQHLDGQGTTNLPYQQALYNAQVNPLMYQAYEDLLRGFYEMGGGLFMHFTQSSANNQYGSWGALQYQDQPTADAPKYQALLDAASGALYTPEYAITSLNADADELGQKPATFTVTRTGDKSLSQDIRFTLSGAATAADLLLPATIHFDPGVGSQVVSIVPIDDGVAESTESFALTLAPGAGYKIDDRSPAASATVLDNPGYVSPSDLAVLNGSFETGALAGWSLYPASNNKTGVVSAASSAASGTTITPRGGAFALWAGGADNNQRSGATPAGVVQRIDLSAQASAIDAGTAHLLASGYGRGDGYSEYAYFEVVFYNAAGVAIGSAIQSAHALTNAWARTALDASIPAGARSVDLRAMMARNNSLSSKTDAGWDDITARVALLPPATVQIQATDPSATEQGRDPAVFTVTRTGGLISQPLTVAYTVSGTATSGSDYTALTGALTFAANQTSATITLTPVDDTRAEYPESVSVQLSASPAYLLGASAVATATIADNDLQTVTLAGPLAPASEAGPTPATFTVTRADSDLLNAPLVVGYTLAGTATNGADYQPVSGTVTIPANQTSAAIVITPIDDAIVEGAETVTLTLQNGAGYSAAGASATTSITDNDTAVPVVTITPPTANASETGPAPASFTVSRATADLSAPLVVGYTIAGTATGGADYQTLAGAVTIPAGQASAPIVVTPLDDAAIEGAETVSLTLQAGPGYALGAPAAATAYIDDNDGAPLPAVTITAPLDHAAEAGSTPAAFIFTRTGTDLTSDMLVGYSIGGTAANGTDYATLNGLATIPAGQSSAQVVVTPADDAAVEGAETVILTLQPGALYTAFGSPATVVIDDNDVAAQTPTVTLAPPIASAAETGPASAAFTVTRTGDSLATPLVVNYALGGAAINSADYATLPASVTIPAGQASALITVLPIDDTAVEGSEAVSVTLSPGGGYILGNVISASVQILDNDSTAPTLPAVTVQATTPTTTEGSATPAVFTFTRAGSTDSALTVSYTGSGTATSGTDYTALPTTVTIPAGKASAVVNVRAVDDTVTEAAETVVLSVTGASTYTAGAPSSATVTIADNDKPAVTIEATDPSATEGTADGGLLTVRRIGSTAAALTVTYTVGGTATNGRDYTSLPGTVTIPAGQASTTLAVAPINDTAAERVETVVVTLKAKPAYTLGAPSAGTVTIVDDDLQTVSVAATDAAAAEKRSDTATFTFTRSSELKTDPLTVNYSLGGTATPRTDYTATGLGAGSGTTGTITFAAGSTTARVTITPIDDTFGEPTESVILTLVPGATSGAAAGYRIVAPTSATASIVDNDGYSLLSIPAAQQPAGNGLAATYYDHADFTGSTVSQLDPTVNFSWGSASPTTGIAATTYSVRWTGQVKAIEAGAYTFQTYSADAARVWINGQLVIDDSTAHASARAANSAGITLTAGQSVSITVEYVEYANTAVMKLLWKRPGQTAFSVIPASQFTAS